MDGGGQKEEHSSKPLQAGMADSVNAMKISLKKKIRNKVLFE